MRIFAINLVHPMRLNQDPYRHWQSSESEQQADPKNSPQPTCFDRCANAIWCKICDLVKKHEPQFRLDRGRRFGFSFLRLVVENRQFTSTAQAHRCIWAENEVIAMTLRTYALKPEETSEVCAYRCSIIPENSLAKLKVGRSKTKAQLIEVSRTGFTVAIPRKLARKISPSSRCELSFGSEVWAVRKSSCVDEGKFSHVQFDRVREKTKIKLPRAYLGYLLPKFDPKSEPELLLFLMLSFIVCVVSLPGVGDQIGTAPKVRKGIQVVWKELTRFF